MSPNDSPTDPDEQPTTPLPTAGPAGGPAAAPVPAANGPSATAYPAPVATAPAAPRGRVPGWVIAASVVGGVVLLGLGFAGGLGTGLLVSHRGDSVVDRFDPRGSLAERLDRDRLGDGLGDRRGRGPSATPTP